MLSKGVIQQIGSPLEFYNRPANRFVAGFFGTLPMNFLNGGIQVKDGKAYFTMPGEALLLPAHLQTIAASYEDKEMVLGIRPESFSLTPVDSMNNNSFRMKVSVIEPLGDRVNVCMTLAAGHRVVANIEPRIKVNVDEHVTTYVDADKVHIFEPGDSGRNLLLS